MIAKNINKYEAIELARHLLSESFGISRARM
ncbi:MAG: hypothetical protein ACJA1S_000177 [Cellvibrionaceae bacterium]|jgi:hypothetical protein